MQDQANKENLTIIAVIVTGLLFVAFSILPSKKSPDMMSQLSTMQQSPVPSFDWFDDVDAPEIHSKEELSKIWQSKPRCCVPKRELEQNNREFYKACYVAMQKYPSDDDIVATCLWLMDGALETRAERIKINEYFIQKYFYYNKPLDRCANCDRANVSVRIARELARQYKSTNRFGKAIKLLERINDERQLDTSDWVIAELSTQLGKYYLSPEYIGNNTQRIEANYLKLKPFRNNETLGKRFGKPGRFDKLEEVYLKLK
ncbi:MAG: hypothetical protein KAI17_01370 [Thiotrichaceae bacterium]|nr:hypothetical protein [Thiotrichaceae bacterium]